MKNQHTKEKRKKMQDKKQNGLKSNSGDGTRKISIHIFDKFICMKMFV